MTMRTMRTEYINDAGDILTVESTGTEIRVSINGTSWTATSSPVGATKEERQVDAFQSDLGDWVSEQRRHRSAINQGVDYARPASPQWVSTDRADAQPKQSRVRGSLAAGFGQS